MTHRIVMAVVHRDGRVLLCHRSPDREWYPDVWDLPGGHVEAGEAAHDALARELEEELGIDAAVSEEPLVGVRFDDVDALVWSITQWSGAVTNRAPDEHDRLEWFSAAELDRQPIAHPSLPEICRLALAAD